MIPVWSDIVYESRGGKAKIENTNIGKYKYANAKELKTQALSKSWSGCTQSGREGSPGKVKYENTDIVKYKYNKIQILQNTITQIQKN